MSYTLVFANGDLNDGSAVRRALTQPAQVVAVDGGADMALQLGYTVSLLIGDMDSVLPATLELLTERGVKILRFPPEKNETDLEIALLELARQGVTDMDVIGALGNRLDQTLANIYLLSLPTLQSCQVRLVSGEQTIWLLHPGDHALMGAVGDTISLIPLAGDVTQITTIGLQYALRQEPLFFGPARGVSNVIAHPAPRLHFDSGLLLVIHTVGRA